MLATPEVAVSSRVGGKMPFNLSMHSALFGIISQTNNVSHMLTKLCG